MVQKCEEVSFVIETVLMVLEVIVCIALIGAVLLQSGKGGGMGSTFGGSDGAFFGKGNDLDTVMAKATVWLGAAFAVITLALAKINA
jgi:preprotein translocase subunit SecG